MTQLCEAMALQYNCIAKCQYNCMRNVLWCQVHRGMGVGGLGGGHADGGRGREYTYCYTAYYHVMLKLTVKKKGEKKGASKLVFYAQSTSAVISGGQGRKGKKNKSHTYRTKTKMLK